MSAAIKHWTLDELHRLPDDGNKYELVRGELFVTPTPSDDHETIIARLARRLNPFVEAQRLGFVYRPRSVVRAEGSEVEPDLMVRAPKPPAGRDWDDAPIPILVVEVLSGSTRRRDLGPKKDFYLDIGVAEYWIIDSEAKTVRVVHHAVPDQMRSNELTWQPAGANDALTLRVSRAFRVESRAVESERLLDAIRRLGSSWSDRQPHTKHRVPRLRGEVEIAVVEIDEATRDVEAQAGT
jgi:Uma2 family endonuclease